MGPQRPSPALVAVLVMLAAACGDDKRPPEPQSLTISGSLDPFLIPLDTRQLTATLRYSDGRTEDVTTLARWTSSDPLVANISPTGLLTANGSGTFQVRATHLDVSGATGGTIDLVATTPWMFRGPAGTEDRVLGIVADPRDDRLYVETESGLSVSEDRGSSWRAGPAQRPGDTSRGLPRVALDPNNPDRVVLARGQTLWLSPDRGQSWTPIFEVINSSPPKYLSTPLVSAIDGAILATSRVAAVGNGRSEFGVVRSTDNGTTWSFHGFNDDRFLIAWDIAEDPVDGTLYTATEIADHPQPYDPPWYRSTDRGQTWHRIPSGTRWHATSHLVEPDTRDVYVFTEGSGIWRSSTRGESWQLASGTNIFGILIRDPFVASRFFAGTIASGSRTGGVLLSRNKASTFQPFGLAGRSCAGVALGADSLRLFASCYQSGIWMIELVPPK